MIKGGIQPISQRRVSPNGCPLIWRRRSNCRNSYRSIGRCLAEWIVTGAPSTVDLRPFRASRFAEGQPWQDADNYGRERLTISR